MRRLNRREFIRASTAFASQALVGSSLFTLGCDLAPVGTLGPPDENGIQLPSGFKSRILAQSGDPVGHSGHIWHAAPDGGAVFGDRRGWIYVSNSELLTGGGASALRFDHKGETVDAYSICSGTRRNCAGGATPWGTWLTCEEVSTGLVYECDPSGVRSQIARPALGRFNHEAVATDPHDRRLYLTEDRPDGRLYRFTPFAWENLEAGSLEVAEVDGEGLVQWHEVPTPNPPLFGTATRHQVPVSTPFAGGEGIAYFAGHVYFATKGDDRVWNLAVEAQALTLLYDRATDPIGQLNGVDNVAVTPAGDLLVAEDGGNMELILMTPGGPALPLVRVQNQPFSELAGPAFDPSGRRLYFSSQRGFGLRGITYEVRGPFGWHRRS